MARKGAIETELDALKARLDQVEEALAALLEQAKPAPKQGNKPKDSK